MGTHEENIQSGKPEDSAQIEKLLFSGLEFLKNNATIAAIPLLQEAADLGDRDAMYFLGKACGGTLKSLDWFQKAGELGDVAAMKEFLDLYEANPEKNTSKSPKTFT